MSSSETAIRTSLGPISSPSKHDDNQPALGTNPVKVAALVDPTGTKVRRIKLVNLSSTSKVAWKVVPKGDTAPTSANMTATGAATDGTIILPEREEYLTLAPYLDLYIVAEGANTPVNVTWFEE